MDSPVARPETELAPFLEQFWRAFTAAESSGDFSDVTPLCDENLVFQSPNEEPYENLQSLVNAWWTPPSDYTIEFDHAELLKSDSMAIQRGIAQDRFTASGESVASHRYNYLAVFKFGDHGWRLSHFISNMIE